MTTAKDRYSWLNSHRYIFQYTALCTCRIMLCSNWWSTNRKCTRNKNEFMFHKIYEERTWYSFHL